MIARRAGVHVQRSALPPMDVRDTPEQAELRRTARQLARELGPRTVVDLDDDKRGERLARAVAEAGWLELRDDDGEGAALAGGVEAAIIAEALAEAVADASFSGPVLAADLARRAGASPPAPPGAAVAFAADLGGPAAVAGAQTAETLYTVDAGSETAYVLVQDGDACRLASAATAAPAPGTDLTRRIRPIPAGTALAELPGQGRPLGRQDLAAWSALGLALTSADLVGLMRGVLDISAAYASDRKQYGAPIGSFQAVQHLLAEGRCLLEGSLSAALHAAWAVDNLEPDEAVSSGRVAKAYCARAARTVCETAVQVHGGIGNTYECMVHVYLRRALLSTQWFGDDGAQLRELQRTRLGVTHGLS